MLLLAPLLTMMDNIKVITTLSRMLSVYRIQKMATTAAAAMVDQTSIPGPTIVASECRILLTRTLLDVIPLVVIIGVPGLGRLRPRARMTATISRFFRLWPPRTRQLLRTSAPQDPLQTISNSHLSMIRWPRLTSSSLPHQYLSSMLTLGVLLRKN
jgi:hypothetical protein